ncbi:MAG TPA: hypothetical protein VKV26_15300 [Dehalococcoidia bacterium]|nr:hypothetical protein [Dehalococcoidia bacterium]
MNELPAADRASLPSLLAAARAAYGQARAVALRPSVERTARACAALRGYALDPGVEPPTLSAEGSGEGRGEEGGR